MAGRANECPFTDRVDHRCSEFFSLERLDHTFKFCFGKYKACPLYQELRAERQLQRALAGEASEVEAPVAPVAAGSQPDERGTVRVDAPAARPGFWLSPWLRRPNAPAPYAQPSAGPHVPLTVAGRPHAAAQPHAHAKPAAGTQSVPAVPRF